MALPIKTIFSRPVPGAVKKRRVGAGTGTPSSWEEAAWLHYLIGAVFFFAAVVLIAWRGRVAEMPRRGTIAPREIVASVDFSYPDAARAEQLARVAVSRQPFVYLRTPQVLTEQTKRLGAFSEETAAAADRLRELLREGPARSVLEIAFQELYRRGVLPEEGRDILLGSEKAGILIVDSDRGEETERAVSDVLVPAECADLIRERLTEKTDLSPVDVGFVTDFCAGMVQPTLRYDRGRTSLLRENARSGIGRVYTEVRQGEVLISKGELVSPAHIIKFRAYQEEMLRRLPAAARITWLLGTALVCLIGITAFGKALRRFFAPSFLRNSRLGLMAAVGLVVLGLARWFSGSGT
nr:hypothetical protein [bacterium]